MSDYICEKCTYVCSSQQSLDRHLASGKNCKIILAIVERARRTGSKKIICQLCLVIFDDKDAFLCHLDISCSLNIELDKIKLGVKISTEYSQIEIREHRARIAMLENLLKANNITFPEIKSKIEQTTEVVTVHQPDLISSTIVVQQIENLGAKAAAAANIVEPQPKVVAIQQPEIKPILTAAEERIQRQKRINANGIVMRERRIAKKLAEEEEARKMLSELGCLIETDETEQIEIKPVQVIEEEVVETVIGQQYSTWFHSGLFVDKFSACNLKQLEEEITKGREGLVNIFVDSVTRQDGKFMYVTDTAEECKFFMNVDQGNWNQDEEDNTLVEMFAAAYSELRKTKKCKSKLIKKFPLREKKIREFFKSLKTLNLTTRKLIAKKCFDPSPFIW